MNNDAINFAEQKEVSVTEVNRNRKLRTISFVLVAMMFLASVMIFIIHLYVNKQFVEASLINKSFISELTSPDNKKKESLFFLIKNRLTMIGRLKQTRSEKSDLLKQIENINQVITIKNLNVKGNIIEIILETDNYEKFDSLLTNLDQYKIDKKSVLVKQTNFTDQKYRISLSFSFL